jgi:hypothetical protein
MRIFRFAVVSNSPDLLFPFHHSFSEPFVRDQLSRFPRQTNGKERAMKIKIIRPKFVHIESGRYKAHIVSATERGVGNGRKQLQLVMEVLNICSFTGCHFNHCIMTDGSAEFYIDRLLKALFKGEFNLNVIDTEDLVASRSWWELARG